MCSHGHPPNTRSGTTTTAPVSGSAVEPGSSWARLGRAPLLLLAQAESGEIDARVLRLIDHAAELLREEFGRRPVREAEVDGVTFELGRKRGRPRRPACKGKRRDPV